MREVLRSIELNKDNHFQAANFELHLLNLIYLFDCEHDVLLFYLIYYLLMYYLFLFQPFVSSHSHLSQSSPKVKSGSSSYYASSPASQFYYYTLYGNNHRMIRNQCSKFHGYRFCLLRVCLLTSICYFTWIRGRGLATRGSC